MSSAADPDVYAWQWYPDSLGGVNSPDASLAAVNNSYEVPYANLGTGIWLYIGIENLGDMSATSPFTLEYNTDGEGRVAVTTSSADIQVITSANETDAAAVTASQVGTGAGSWVDGEFDEGDGQTDANITTGYTNHVFCIQPTTALTGGESIDLFLRYESADATNDSPATINLTIAAAPASNPRYGNMLLGVG